MYKTQIACAVIIFFIGTLYFTSTGKNDKKVLLSVMPIFLENWLSYREKLAIIEPECLVNEEKKKPAEDYHEEIGQLIKKINEAAEEMNIDSLDAIGRELAMYRFDDTKQEIVEKIQKAITEFNIDYLKSVKV